MPTIIPNWHPIFVHFTVALFSLAAGLFVMSAFIKSPLKEQWRLVARWNLWFAAGFTVITGLTGLYAYDTVAHDTPSHAAMTEHRNWAIVTITLILTLAIWYRVRVRRAKTLGALFVGTMAVTGGILASTAWHGGEAVYRYGLGVMSLPKTDAHAHGGTDHAGGGEDTAPPDAEKTHSEEDHTRGEDMRPMNDGGRKKNDASGSDMRALEEAAERGEARDDGHDRPHEH